MSHEKILAVDDEKNILEVVKYNLQKEGFRVLAAGDGAKGLELCRREQPALMILDLMMPELNGLEVCRLAKQDEKTRHIPILMLTVKGTETDKIVGLEMGADDYMTKPFSPRELVARVKAILRRTATPASVERAVRIGDLAVDWERYRVTVGGKPVTLTSKEFELLRALVEAKGRVLSREYLLDNVWGYDRSMELQTRTVDLHVSQLRKKLKAAGKHLLTIKNAGYCFDVETS